MDVLRLKTQVEMAMEMLLRAADARVNWRQPQQDVETDSSMAGSLGCLYTFLPGVYKSASASPAADASSQVEAAAPAEREECSFRVVLHGDNTFEYRWTLQRPAPRAMEYTVEMTGAWSKPVLNRSRHGDDDQRVLLSAKRIRFQRCSHFDPDKQTWKLCLKTLTRHGSEWAPVGETETSVPPICVELLCGSDGSLESLGSAVVARILSNSPACRVLAGLTKKVANKLGTPEDVMTDQWLPTSGTRLERCPDDAKQVKPFNPLCWYVRADATAASVSSHIADECADGWTMTGTWT